MTPTPDQLRARADREESVYNQVTLAAMLRAGADALEERDRLREALYLADDGCNFTHMYREWAGDPDGKTKARAALTPPAEVYDWNDRYDAKWEPGQ